MTLLDALQIINQNRSRRRADRSPSYRLALTCGFVPLHFKTFLTAEMVLLRPGTGVDIAEGLYGDLSGSLERLKPETCDAVVAVIEWSDLDARLGVRSTGGWHPGSLPDVVRTAHLQLQRIGRALKQLGSIPRIVVGPTLPLPPIFYGRPHRLSSSESDLRAGLAQFHRDLLSDRVTVIAAQAVDMVSAFPNRLDLKSELAVGFPYTMSHADALARLVASEICGPVRKKGIITDLDDTLWRGILGEIGVHGVCWTLEKKAHIHALYQQVLNSLAGSGTLVAVASKNDPDLVAEALNRPDLLLSKEAVFPVEAHWGPKSQSVARILAAWNIAADAVVFVDDSTMELAEVQAAFPEMECLAFSRDDPEKAWDLLVGLRDRFGTSDLTREDSLRVESLRSRAAFEVGKESAANADAFLRDAQAEIVFATDKSRDPRPFELINKTNQFNLNGARLTEAEWAEVLANHGRFMVKATYNDRYGPLGEIAVLVGTIDDGRVSVHHWVMSCRAFSRRIEHRCLQYLFQRFEASDVLLHFKPTPRNGPIHEFLAALLGSEPSGDVHLPRSLFEKNCPVLYHSVREI